MDDPKGYYPKFTVVRNSDSELITERTFVLLMDTDELAPVALRAYRDAVEARNPDHPLVADLDAYLAEVEPVVTAYA